MTRAQVLQEIRKMQFEQVYTGWEKRSLTQEEAARILGVTDRTFRRYINRYDNEGLEGIYDKRLTQASHRRAPLDEMLDVCNIYKEKYSDFNVRRFYRWYQQEHEGKRSYSWVKVKILYKKRFSSARAGEDIKDILCEQHKRTVNNSNCVSFNNRTLQIPKEQYRCHYVKARVKVNFYDDGAMAIFHGPRRLAAYDKKDTMLKQEKIQPA